MKKIWLACLLLAGCASAPVEVSKLDMLQNTYELAPVEHMWSFWLSMPSAEETKELLRTTAPSVCAPGMVGLLDVERPDYIRLEMVPRGYLRCR